MSFWIRERPGGQLIQGQMQYLDEPQSDNGKSLLQGKVKGLFDAYKGGTIRKSPEFEAYYRSKYIQDFKGKM